MVLHVVLFFALIGTLCCLCCIEGLLEATKFDLESDQVLSSPLRYFYYKLNGKRSK